METTMEAVAVEEKKRRRERGQHGLGNVYSHRANWWLDVRITKIRHRIKLGPIKLLEKREARQIAQDRIKELLMPKASEPRPVVGAIPFSEFATKYVAMSTELKTGWKKYAGLKPEDTQFQHALEFFGEKSLKDITTSDVEDFRRKLLTRKVGKHQLKPASANRYVSMLRAAFYWAMANGLAGSNPVIELADKMLKEAPIATRVLKRDEQDKLLKCLPTWLRLAVIFCLQTAARRGDVVNLTWKSVNRSHVEFLETKEGKKRAVSLSKDAKSILDALRPENAKPDACVFEPSTSRKTLAFNIRREWDRAVRTCAIPRIRFHDLRHTALTRLVESRVDLTTVMQIAGHASLKTTQKYLHSSDERKQKAVDKLSEFGRYLPTALAPHLVEMPVSGRIIN